MASSLDGSSPAASNVRGAEYPRIHPDLRVTFRLLAPNAQQVQVQPGSNDNGLGTGPFDMVRGEDGSWTVTTPPAVPGFHYYSLLVDGVAVNDPASDTYFGYDKQTSGVEVPEPGVDFYDAQDVPHGEVRAHWYRSQTTDQWRRAYVYTPPDYDTHPETRYPVLYLQHGGGEDETSWAKQGRANFVLDNLIASGKALPMIVVMDCGYATPVAVLPPPAPRPRPLRAETGGQGQRQELPGEAMWERLRQISDAFEVLMINEIVPMVDATYRTIPDREHRGIAGLSMGSFEALRIGLGHLDLFASIAALSGGPFGGFDLQTACNGVFRDPAAFNKKVRLFWLGAGTAEVWIHTLIVGMHEALQGAGVRHVFYESAGTAHEWQTWRRHLHDLAPRLFRG